MSNLSLLLKFKGIISVLRESLFNRDSGSEHLFGQHYAKVIFG
ncbi:Uncharacterised protein [Vibrio cholerae]|uniref:Uncharacterized protein n=1 Tax=Vibrio cholerae TaxID=666 RepID=A0A656AJE7_VIBCL|nr:Uncharacterised protein [Vibrio cholerae]CSA66938.1 Uncharacterised protein [Vibrio cholerae]CSA86861.1 Uncharacterised protein [Vibrio cholerae]CSC24153.1 Uncharacterised protein [Vibrio cholerae]CSC24969.1 Uncharacterised protein [Vibrio cholerae]